MKLNYQKCKFGPIIIEAIIFFNTNRRVYVDIRQNDWQKIGEVLDVGK